MMEERLTDSMEREWAEQAAQERDDAPLILVGLAAVALAGVLGVAGVLWLFHR